MNKLRVYILVLLILLTNNIAFASNITDIDNSIYKDEIGTLIDSGIINGFPDGTFRPEEKITRAEFAKVLTLSLGLELSPDSASKFEDVNGKWHEGYVGAVANSTLMIGTSENSFMPDSNITREEVSLTLIRAFEMLEIAERVEIENKFLDADEISFWAEKAILLIDDIGLLEGIQNENGTYFLPKTFANRQLVAKLIYELLYNKVTYDVKIENMSLTEIDAENTETENKTTENNNNDLDDPANPQSKKDVDDLISKYKNKLKTIQNNTQAELDSLISRALSEYDNGGSLGLIYNKYKKFALELESETDDKVSLIISKMEEELIENGHDSEYAKQLEDEYESIKSELKIEINL